MNPDAHREEDQETGIPGLVVMFGIDDNPNADPGAGPRDFEGSDLDVRLPDNRLAGPGITKAADDGGGDEEQGAAVGDSHALRVGSPRQPSVWDASERRQ